jgi:hypothetical protein
MAADAPLLFPDQLAVLDFVPPEVCVPNPLAPVGWLPASPEDCRLLPTLFVQLTEPMAVLVSRTRSAVMRSKFPSETLPVVPVDKEVALLVVPLSLSALF